MFDHLSGAFTYYNRRLIILTNQTRSNPPIDYCFESEYQKAHHPMPLSPFQKLSLAAANKTGKTYSPPPPSQRSFSAWKGLFWGVVLGLALVLVFFYYKPIHTIDGRLFVASGNLSQTQARQQYADSLTALRNNQNEAALVGFDALKPSYPGLSEFILLHQAEAQAKLGNETKVQKALQELLNTYPDSPLRHKAHYMLGQSHLRARESEQALAIFKRLNQQLPKHEYGIASLYYLGVLAQQQNALKDTETYWTSYLRQCPDCVFSGDIAEILDKQVPQPTPELHGLIGSGLVNSSRQWQKALAHLKQAPAESQQNWFALGKAYQNNNQPTDAETVWIKGLPHAETSEQVQQTVDLLLKTTKQPKALLLEKLDTLKLPQNGDYILWRLSQLDPGKAQATYQAILSRYPQGDYAPESSWNLIWPLLTSHQDAAYLSQAQTHMSKYPYAKSAAKALFWIGKLQEKTNANQAIGTYQQVLTQYPDNYYAFRAYGRLSALEKRQGDLGWKTQAVGYSPAYDLKTLQILPAQTEFSQAYQAHQNASFGSARAYQAAQELQQIGAADDLMILMEESLGEENIPASVESWVHYQNNERPKAIRTIRDALQNRAKKTFKAIVPTTDELKLLYPVYFQTEIAENAVRQKIDPYLIQALMREESYFNEFAISSSNARGLMQLLPTTAAEVAQWEGLQGVGNLYATALFQPSINIRLGSRYLNYLHKTFESLPPHLVSMASTGAYNGGPNAMKRWVAASSQFQNDPDWFVEQIPYEQSRDYVKKVFGSYWNYRRLYGQSFP